MLFVGLMTALCLWPVQESMSAGPRGTNSKPGANTDTGRSIFNGKGRCYYCHGMDGDLEPPTLPRSLPSLIPSHPT